MIWDNLAETAHLGYFETGFTGPVWRRVKKTGFQNVEDVSGGRPLPIREHHLSVKQIHHLWNKCVWIFCLWNYQREATRVFLWSPTTSQDIPCPCSSNPQPDCQNNSTGTLTLMSTTGYLGDFTRTKEPTSRVIKELCSLTGMRKSRTTSYPPMGNRMCERFNRTVLNLLGTLEHHQKVNRKACVPTMVHAYNCSWDDSTGVSPCFLMFGRNPRLPIDLVFGLLEDTKVPSVRYVKDLRD